MNVLSLALAQLRQQFYLHVWATVLCTAGWVVLAAFCWEAAVGLALLAYGFAVRGRALMAMGHGGS